MGITDYIHLGDEPGGDLPGAERDARVMRDVLVQRWGFPSGNVRGLLNGEATRSAIQEGLTGWLPSVVQPGDHVTVFFAGHGSQMWDESGDEDDGLDETIAPADVRPETTEFDISDDEFGEWLTGLPTDNVVVYLDNCNSGTGTRDVTPFARTRRLERDLSAVERPETMSRRALPGQEDRTGFDAGTGRVLELAAAQPHQAAVDAYFPGEGEADSFHGGAFTTFLVRELWKAPVTATYEEVFRRVRESLERNRFEQDPYLSEEVSMKSAPVFHAEGAGPTTSEAALPVVSADGGRAELGGGQSLGVTTGSVFETTGGGRLVVESVTPERSAVRVASGSVDEGERARMTAYRFPRAPLRVNVGEDGKLTAGITLQNFSTDQLGGRNLFEAGTRFRVDASYAFRTGGSTWTVFAVNAWRDQGNLTLDLVDQEGTEVGDTLVHTNSQNLAQIGVAGSIPVASTYRVRPVVDLQIQSREGTGSGWLLGAGGDFPLRIFGSLDAFPRAKVLFGRVDGAERDGVGVWGGVLGGSLRWRR